MLLYCRFELAGAARYGVIAGDSVQALTAAPWSGGSASGKSFALGEVRLLAPCEPTKIVCVGRNYVEHAAELGNQPPREPLIFFKPPSAVIGPEDAIVLPALSKRVDYEGELALVMGRRLRNPKPDDDVLEAVFGYTCLNDVTARDLQKTDGQFTRAKGFDTFCPMGPVVATGLDPKRLAVETYVNGERRQRGGVEEMIFPLDAIIRFIAAVMTLEPGDVISTGTPAGVGPLGAGDVVEVAIEGIGRLRNPVAASKG
jgi:2-keto-4-pentenoate hydratase/2-oxohepta-3-ene-1,7-dioic acid hydratase in catechol pathway